MRYISLTYIIENSVCEANNEKSSLQNIISSVMQGSVVEPTLSILFFEIFLQ